MFGNGLHYLVPLGHPTLLEMGAHHESQQKKYFKKIMAIKPN